jgi:hypothetical protein
VRERCLARTDWEYGFPTTGEVWPGMRTMPALELDELGAIEAQVRQATGAKKLWVGETEAGQKLNHNCVQVVGAVEGSVKPHTDSLNLCRYAAVIYLTPDPDPGCGTSFYRLRYPNGGLGGNYCSAPHANLREALGVKSLPPDAWHEELRIENRFNRILLYKANMVHSASAYFGFDHPEKRMTAVFFWMA